MSPPVDLPAPVLAEQLPFEAQIPSPVAPILFRLARPVGLSAFELGPSGDTHPFSVPPVEQHALLIGLQTCQGAEARIGDLTGHGLAHHISHGWGLAAIWQLPIRLRTIDP